MGSEKGKGRDRFSKCILSIGLCEGIWKWGEKMKHKALLIYGICHINLWARAVKATMFGIDVE